MAYFQAVRLNSVRQELRTAADTVTVHEIAQRWGFWHTGSSPRPIGGCLSAGIPREGTAQDSALGILHRGRNGGRSQLRLAAITCEN
jgi:hypothetical protein